MRDWHWQRREPLVRDETKRGIQIVLVPVSWRSSPQSAAVSPAVTPPLAPPLEGVCCERQMRTWGPATSGSGPPPSLLVPGRGSDTRALMPVLVLASLPSQLPLLTTTLCPQISPVRVWIMCPVPRPPDPVCATSTVPEIYVHRTNMMGPAGVCAACRTAFSSGLPHRAQPFHSAGHSDCARTMRRRKGATRVESASSSRRYPLPRRGQSTRGT